jgi:hypothetical protein
LAEFLNIKLIIMPYYIATFFLDKKSGQKSQDGGILSTHKDMAGPVLRRSCPLLQFDLSLIIMNEKPRE